MDKHEHFIKHLVYIVVRDNAQDRLSRIRISRKLGEVAGSAILWPQGSSSRCRSTVPRPLIFVASLTGAFNATGGWSYHDL
ncbi:hypothetical protein BHE74_00038941 [Ensete ventricosum]|nr:hypothetical protein BHE74_00038941 [Ensete ventricosum]